MIFSSFVVMNITQNIKKENRLIYIDALRSFAILMMLQGHFVSALLADEYKDKSNTIYNIWEYFRGITAPTFFTITGFVFMFLLLKQKAIGLKNPRVKKGIERGIKLILWGYALRFSFGIFFGYTHKSYYFTDVLHIIGISLIILCFIYLLFYKLSSLYLKYLLLTITFFSFLFERYYNEVFIPYLPIEISHYLTKINGAIFSLFPWFGYVSIGAFLSILFIQFKETKNFYKKLPTVLGITGLLLLFLSTPLLKLIGSITNINVFTISGGYNYLFTRLGDVFLIFSFFVYFRNYLNHSLFIKIGKVTLSIYIVHHIILYGSWFHTGLTRWFKYSLNYTEAFFGALIFMLVVCFLVIKYRQLVNESFSSITKFILHKSITLKNNLVRLRLKRR